MRNCQHDDALNRNAMNHGLHPKDPFGGAKGGLRNGFAARDFVRVLAGVHQHQFDVIKAVSDHVRLELLELFARLKTRRATEVHFDRAFGWHNGF